MRFSGFRQILPTWRSALLAVVAAVLLILAFPDFELWFLAWFALVPLMWAVDCEKASTGRCFLLGWLFGFLFFSGTCWWLTYAPIHYAGFPWPVAYLLLFCVTAVAGLFPALFAAILSLLLRRFGSWAFLAAPFVWVFTEFLRYWTTGNNWNAMGYSQAFADFPFGIIASMASIGGVALSSFLTVLMTTFFAPIIIPIRYRKIEILKYRTLHVALLLFAPAPVILGTCFLLVVVSTGRRDSWRPTLAHIVAIQPNVPMSGLDRSKWEKLRDKQITAAQAELAKIHEQNTPNEEPILVVLPESPMNFMYEDDREFSSYINDFARRSNVSVLFNSSEPDITTGKYFNSAVLVGSDGHKTAQYNKIFLLPFGEAVPGPFEGLVPAFVGTFAYGSKYSLIPVGEAKAGVMICFESHFGQLSREYVRNGADVVIEMTNDGYLGPTAVLKQHLANAIFRAIEIHRPVLRVTNVGVTAAINEFGYVRDPAPAYAEATRTWTVEKSDGSQTFYVKYGDWFAWLCSLVTVVLLAITWSRDRRAVRNN